MKRVLLFLVLTLLTAVFVNAADWTTDYKAALVQAKAQKKLVLLDFTGSDWCGFCQLLDKEVLAKPEFQQYVNQNFIFVTVDFPHGKQLPPELKQQNQDLGDKFQVGGYPTLLIVDTDGKQIGRVEGYHPGSGPATVINKLKESTQN